MQVVILAGGLGTRLRPMTESIPKSMVEVAGVPYLEHQLKCLQKQNFTDIILLTGYLGEQIEAHFGDGSRFGVRIRYSREASPQGTGGALRDAKKFLADSFVLIYGDSYLPIDYGNVLRDLVSSDAEGVVVVTQGGRKEISVPGNIELDHARYVMQYRKNAPEGLPFVDAGVLAFRASVVDRIRGTGVVSLENEIFPKLIDERLFLAHITDQLFYDIGTPDRLRIINELFEQKEESES